MLQDCQLSPMYFAVDALDECAERRPDLIHLISTSLAPGSPPQVKWLPMKWLLSSRPEVELLAELQGHSSPREL